MYFAVLFSQLYCGGNPADRSKPIFSTSNSSSRTKDNSVRHLFKEKDVIPARITRCRNQVTSDEIYRSQTDHLYSSTKSQFSTMPEVDQDLNYPILSQNPYSSRSTHDLFSSPSSLNSSGLASTNGFFSSTLDQDRGLSVTTEHSKLSSSDHFSTGLVSTQYSEFNSQDHTAVNSVSTQGTTVYDEEKYFSFP